MILEKAKYLPYLILMISVITILFTIGLKKTNRYIEKYWVCRKTKLYTLSNILFLLAFIVLSISVLDPKGNEEKIESSISDQKTIILIDSSLSMLVEDVRPNRFERALLLARHFIQRASGHQVSIVLFSDLQKKIIPFTNDIDFLDAKLSGMDRRNVSAGGSNLSQALAESARYFVGTTKNGTMRGNILILSDFEEHEKFKFDLPDSITVAAIGLGTAQGGPIPIRSNDGVFKGNKSYEGKEVISKLGEAGLKHLEGEIPKFKKWVALSYSLPSDEIIEYFRETYLNSLKTGLVSTRPTLAKPFVAGGMFLLLLSLILRSMPAFAPLLLLLIVDAHSSELDNYSEMSKRERFKLSEELMTKGELDKAAIIYEENNAANATIEDKVNYLSTKLNTEDSGWALKELNQIYNESDTSQKIKEIIRNNTLVSSKNEDKKEQEKNKEQSSQDEKKDEQKESEQKDEKTEKNKSNNKKKGEESPTKENEKNEDKKDDAIPQENKEENAREQLEEHEKKQSQERKMIKLPALLKQLSDDDAALQRKYTDTATSDQENHDEKKDW